MMSQICAFTAKELFRFFLFLIHSPSLFSLLYLKYVIIPANLPEEYTKHDVPYINNTICTIQLKLPVCWSWGAGMKMCLHLESSHTILHYRSHEHEQLDKPFLNVNLVVNEKVDIECAYHSHKLNGYGLT